MALGGNGQKGPSLSVQWWLWNLTQKVTKYIKINSYSVVYYVIIQCLSAIAFDEWSLVYMHESVQNQIYTEGLDVFLNIFIHWIDALLFGNKSVYQ